MKIAIICVGVVTLRFRTVPPHGSSNKTRVNRAMPHHRMHYCQLMCTLCGDLINNTKNMYKINNTNSTKKNKKKQKEKRNKIKNKKGGGQGGGKIYNFKCNLITHLRIQI